MPKQKKEKIRTNADGYRTKKDPWFIAESYPEERPKGKNRQLKVSVGPEAHAPFYVVAEGTALENGRVDFHVGISVTVSPSEPSTYKFSVGGMVDAEYSPFETVTRNRMSGENLPTPIYHLVPGFAYLKNAIEGYDLTEKERDQLTRQQPGPDPGGPNALFAELLKKILEGAGYVITIEREVPRPDFFYAPTADHAAQRVFSADKRGNFLLDLMDIHRKSNISDRYIYDEKGIEVIGFKIDVDIPSEKAIKGHVQLSIPFDFRQDGGFNLIPIKELQQPETKDKINRLLQEIEQKISKELDPLTLRVKDAFIYLSQERGNRKFDYTESELLDLLYKRNRGYHAMANKNRVRDRIQLISKMKLTYAIKIGNRVICIEDIPYIILNPEGRPYVEYQLKGSKTKKRYNFLSVEIPERYYNLFFGGFSGQFKRESLLLTGSKYSLYKYVATWWRIQWLKDKGEYQWYLQDILRGAGIAPPTKTNTARFMSKLAADLEDMKKSGLIGNYRRLNKNRNPVADMWQFEAPQDLKDRFEHIGEEYKKAKEIKGLKAKKKKLKLKTDIIELEKGLKG